MQVPLGPSRFPTLVWHRAALVGLALLKFLTPPPPPPPPRAGTDRDRPSLRASLLRPKLGSFRKLSSFRAPSIRRALPVLLGGLLSAVGSVAMAQDITSVAFRAGADQVFKIGDTVWVDVTYNGQVSAQIGATSLTIRVGADTAINHRTATCAPQGNLTVLECGYVVAEGDAGELAVVGTALTGGSGLQDTVFDNVTVGQETGVSVDGIRIGIASVTVTGQNLDEARTAYKAGDTVTIRVTFDEATTPVGLGSFGVTLYLDGDDRPMTRTTVDQAGLFVEFSYIVAANDNTSRIRVRYTNADTLKDVAGNAGLNSGATLTMASPSSGTTKMAIDNEPPRMIAVRGTSSEMVHMAGGTPVELTVQFSEQVTVTGTPILDVTVGSETGGATCEAASGVRAMTCNLTILPGWSDPNSISIPQNPLRLPGSAEINDANDHTLDFAFSGTQLPNDKVDGIAPWIRSLSLSGPSTAKVNEQITIKITFSEDVGLVDGSDDNRPVPRINVVGAESNDAVYVGGSASAWEYRYTITEADIARAGADVDFKLAVAIPATQHPFASLTNVADVAGNVLASTVDATRPISKVLTVPTTTDDNNAKVRDTRRTSDTTKPTAHRVRIVDEKKAFRVGNRVTFAVLFSEPVSAPSDVELGIKVGSTNTKALLDGDSSGQEVRFVYVVPNDESGSISVTELRFGADGSLKDTNTLSNGYEGGSRSPGYWELIPNGESGHVEARTQLECDAPTATSLPRGCRKSDRFGEITFGQKTLPIRTRSLSGYIVDNEAPRTTKAELLRSPPPGAVGKAGQRYYGEGDVIRARLTLSEAVMFAGEATEKTVKLRTTSPALQGCQLMDLELVSSNRKTLTFECQVTNDEVVGAGLGLTALQVDGDTNTSGFEDQAGNPLPPASGLPLGAQRTHLVDGTLSGEQEGVAPITDSGQQPQTAAVRTTTVVRSTTPTGGYYKTGDTITIEVSLSPAVTFTSAPQLLVNFDEGGSERLTPAERISSSGTPTTRLTYSYRVASGDEDLDGFTGSLSGGGTATVEDGRRATLGSVSVSGIRIDALAPELDSLRITSSAGSDGTYTVGDNIVVSATFSEDVERQGVTDPSVPILVGDVTRTATLQSPNATSGGDIWVFSYKVVAGDNDADGVSIAANALDGDLEDAAGNDADIAHSAVSASTLHKVDTQGPSVTGVAVTGAGDNDLFLEGDTITATVTFDEEVEVVTRGTNAVRVRFNIGTEPQTATYASGDGTETLTFTYDVEEGDTGQISLPADALEGEVEDAAGNEAEGTLALSGGPYTVDASAPMLVGAPSISSAPRTGDTYAVDETITLQVRFDEPVMVTGEPRLPIQVGPRPRNIVVYTSGSGTDTLTFSYTVRNGDNDDDGVSVDANALRLPAGAAIADVNGLTAAIEHGALADQPGHKVDAIAPGIESVAITSTPASDDAYLIDETIEVTVTFSEDIATDGTPTLDLMVGEGARAAACAQGSAGTQLTCSYTVVANDFDPDGISVDENMLEGTITDMVGNPAMLTHEALVDDPAHKVYAAAPEAVRTIDRLSLAAGGGTNSLDLTGIFTGFQLSYAAVSSNTNVATATVSGTELTVVSGMEGTARVTVTASNLAGEASVSFDVLVATDPAETAVLNDALAAIGRSMLSSTASVIGSRFELASTGSQMALGGSRFGGSLSPQMQRFLAGNDPFALEERMSERALFSGSGSQQAYGGGYGLTADRLLTGTSFNMPLNAMGTGDAQFAVWGAGDLQSFEGEPDDGMYDGSSSSGYIGVDARGDGWLAGVSVSRSGAEADYDFDGTARVTGVRGGGTLETSVTAFHPYARLEVGADSEVWVIGGFGGGEADLSRTHVSGSQSSDLSMAMAVGGLRRALAMEFGGADLSLRGDAGFLSLETDSGMMAVDGLSASVSRLRLGLEAAWEGESATPFVEVSGRFDGGDGQTGGGLELAGGLRILNPESGFGLEAKGRILAMHTGDGYSESGIGVTASFEPGAAGRGITFRLSPRWGGSADSTDLFWDEVGNVRDASQYAYGLDRSQTWGVDAALGYGFGLRSMPGVVTPFGQMDVTGAQDQRIRVGVRYGLMQGLLGGTQVELSAERVDGEMHRVGETRVLVSGRARF